MPTSLSIKKDLWKHLLRHFQRSVFRNMSNMFTLAHLTHHQITTKSILLVFLPNSCLEEQIVCTLEPG